MPSFEVTMTDRSIELVADAHAYQQEGQMTTFFRNDEPRSVVDSWSTRVFSVRTAEIFKIRRMDDASAAHPKQAAYSTSPAIGSRHSSLRPSAALRAVER